MDSIVIPVKIADGFRHEVLYHVMIIGTTGYGEKVVLRYTRLGPVQAQG